jgi:flagellar motor switch protein FliG
MRNKDMDMMYKQLSSPQKTALLLISLGHKWATEILRLMKENEVRKVSFWINRMSYVPQELTERVVRDFYAKLMKKTSLGTTGGEEYLFNILSGIMGEDNASKLVQELVAKEEYEAFSLLKKIDVKQLAAYLKQETPQTIALMLSYIDPQRSANIVSSLPTELQTDVIMKIAKMEETDPDIVSRIEGVLSENLASFEIKQVGGRKMVADILNTIGRGLEKTILEQLTEKDFELATEIKDLMFVFDDIVLLDDKSIQKVLKEIEQDDLIVALKGANEEVKDKVFKNISKRQTELIADELAFLGAVKASVVQGAQQKIVNVIRRLDEEGQILIQGKGGGGDEVFA